MRCSERSKQLNNTRIKVLQAREDAVQKVVKESQAKLSDISKDSKRYKALLIDLIVQVRPGDLGPVQASCPSSPLSLLLGNEQQSSGHSLSAVPDRVHKEGNKGQPAGAWARGWPC